MFFALTLKGFCLLIYSLAWILGLRGKLISGLVGLKILWLRFSSPFFEDFFPFFYLFLFFELGYKLTLFVSVAVDCQIVPGFVLVGFGGFKKSRATFPPFHPLLPLFISKVLDLLHCHDANLLDVVINLIKVKGLFLDLESFLISDGSEEVFKLFRSIIRMNDAVGIFIDEVDFMVCVVEDHMFLRVFLHFLIA